jgi:hypothetical protein
MTVKPYGREHALALLEPSGMTNEWTTDDRGVWPHERHEHLWRWGMPDEFEVTAWKPAVVFAQDPDAPDLTNTPALPFPFDGRDLAAFMLAGYGCMVADFYGDWASGPEAHQLSRIDPGNNFAKRAVKEAFDAYRNTVGIVGGRDLELYRQACESCEAYTAASREAIARHDTAEVAHPQPDDSDDRRRAMDAEYTRRMTLVNAELEVQETEMTRIQAEDKAAEQKWLRAMVTELLKPATETSPELPQPAPAMEPAAHPPKQTPPPIATGAIAYAFDGLRNWSELAWKKKLGSPPKWLEACIALRGQRGIREHHWNPVFIAAALVHNGHANQNRVRGRFQRRPELAAWREEWMTYEADNFDTQ